MLFPAGVPMRKVVLAGCALLKGLAESWDYEIIPFRSLRRRWAGRTHLQSAGTEAKGALECSCSWAARWLSLALCLVSQDGRELLLLRLWWSW
jgi:hypothetical protein